MIMPRQRSVRVWQIWWGHHLSAVFQACITCMLHKDELYWRTKELSIVCRLAALWEIRFIKDISAKRCVFQWIMLQAMQAQMLTSQWGISGSSPLLQSLHCRIGSLSFKDLVVSWTQSLRDLQQYHLMCTMIITTTVAIARSLGSSSCDFLGGAQLRA